MTGMLEKIYEQCPHGTLKETAEHGLSRLLDQGSLLFSGSSPGSWLPEVALTVL